MDQLEARFANILSVSDQAGRLSVIAILAWIAASDGQVDEAEQILLCQLSKTSDQNTQIAIEIGKRNRVYGLRLASNLITKMGKQQSELLVVLAVGMCLADGYVKPSETHILLYLADLTGVGFLRLNSIFREATGHSFPELGDPSSAHFWKTREGTRSRGSRTGSTSSHLDRRSEAFAILGLSNASTEKEIKAAYRRLASIHHPDRFSTLGPEAIQAASKTFRRIKEAHDILLSGK